MKLSADSLYHFTISYQNLESILKSGFRYSILNEEVPFSLPNTSPFSIPGIVKHKKTSYGVCFCDIPLKLCQEHKEQYGNYVIGLSKEWGISNGITPIRYIHYYTPDINHDSYRRLKECYSLYKQHGNFPFNFYLRVLKDLGKINEIPLASEFDNLPIFAKEGILLMCAQLMDMAEYILFTQNFLRSYEDEWNDRVTNKKSNRRFYDEKEWRAIKIKQENENLTFNLNDITEIIVQSNEEKEVLKEYLLKTFNMNDIENFTFDLKTWNDIS